MRLLTLLLLLAATSIFAQSPDEKDVIATVQKTFNGIAAHDSAMILSTMLPDAGIYFVRDGAAPQSTAGTELAARIGSTKQELLERFTGIPAVLIRGTMAQVWGDYEFLRDGKFSHCGVDSVSLFKTADGWKIATIAYTVETTGCKPR